MLAHFVGNGADNNITSALTEKGGSRFVEACNEISSVEEGSIVVTEGFRLNCRMVIHCHCAPTVQEEPRKRVSMQNY